MAHTKALVEMRTLMEQAEVNFAESDPYSGNRRISGFYPRLPLTKKEAAAMVEDGLDLN